MQALTGSLPVIFDSLQDQYPETVAAFSSMENGEQALQAVLNLQQQWARLNIHSQAKNSPFAYCTDAASLPACDPSDHFDVIIAGGGLGLIAGAALAARGLKVLVFDRDRVGAAHREWNISELELDTLLRWRIFTRDEIRQTIARRYKRGIISFNSEGTGVAHCPLRLEGVLDVALDAQAVLDLARKRFLEMGGLIKEGRSFRCLHMARTGDVASVFEVQGPHGTEYYRARLAVDTMGSVSPIAMGLNGGLPFDGVCPTVGTIVEGLGGDPEMGDVLVSVAAVEDERQLIWEAFPSRGDETTVYLFYYDRAGEQQASRQNLIDLFEQYFRLLPGYRTPGPHFKHVKPVFGYIPSRHGRTGNTAARGLICLGDSAAGQSPLTFCGFGSFVRHIGRASMLISFALDHNLLERKHLRQISPHQANLRVAWVFSRFMQPWPGSDPFAVNRLMNVFSQALLGLGPKTTRRFLQDRYNFAEYLRIMLATARRYPGVFSVTLQALRPVGLAKWTVDICLFGLHDLFRSVYLRLPRWLKRRTMIWAGKHSPTIALRLLSKQTLWKAIR